VAIIAASADEALADDLDARLTADGAGHVQRIVLAQRTDSEAQAALAAVEHADLVVLCADQPLRLSTLLGGTALARLLRRRNADGMAVAGIGAGADRLGRLLGALALNPFVLGIGLDADTAAFIGPDNVLEVVGVGSVTVVDPTDVGHSNAADAGPSDPISITNLRVHVLVHGSRYDLDFRRPL
jgi:cyanophycinase